MIKFLVLIDTITLPGRLSTLTSWNHNEHGKLVRVEESPDGFTFVLGSTDDKGVFKPTGETVEVYRHMVKHVTRVKTQEQKK